MTPEEAADAAQDWKGMDGATAFLLIERHADGWNEVRQMMDAWLRANVAAAVLSEREAVRELLRESLEALTCGDTGDDLEDSHRCGRCDEYVDRNAKLRMKIRAALAQGQENKA